MKVNKYIHNKSQETREGERDIILLGKCFSCLLTAKRQSSHGSAISIGLASLEISATLISTIINCAEIQSNPGQESNIFLRRIKDIEIIKLNEDLHTYQINMSLIILIEVRYNLTKLTDYFVMTGHVSCKNRSDHSFSYFFERFVRKISKNVVFRIFQNTKCYGTVVVFQWGYIIVTNRKFSLCVDLKSKYRVFLCTFIS
jgi:hypothetical protein